MSPCRKPSFLVRGTPRTWEKLAVNQATYTRIRVGNNSAEWPPASRNSGKNVSGVWENYQTNMASVTSRLAEFLRQPSGRSSSLAGTCVCACMSVYPSIHCSNYLCVYPSMTARAKDLVFSWKMPIKKQIIHLNFTATFPLFRLSPVWWQLLRDSREIEK